MEKVRFGIVGLGNMGTSHAHNVFDGKVPKLELAAICDIAEGRRAYAKEQFPGVTIFEDAEKMYKSGLVDAVIVATPHYDHPGLVIEALEAGLNVITEKPAGVYTKQVLEMNEAAEKSDKLFGIMYNQRMNPVYQQLRKMIQTGELGTIKRVNWIITDWYRCQTYHDSCTWRSTWKTEGGGALINQNPHQLDLWQWLFGMPSKIMSHVSFGRYYDIEVEDDVTAYMEYDNGMTGVYITSTGEAPGTNRLEIACDMGRVVVEDNKITFDRNVISEREYNTNNKTEVFGTPECWKCEVPVKGENEAHVGILKDFTRALITGDHELLAPGSEGIKGLTISNAIHYSAWTGGWVNLKDFPHEDFKRILDEKIASSTVVKKEIQITANTRGSY